MKTVGPDQRPLYSELFMQLCAGGKRHKFKAGEYIFKQGDVAEHLYLILSGEVDVVAPNFFRDGVSVQDRLFPGGIFGELALLEKLSARQRTVVAETDVEVLEISKKAFDDALHRTNPHLHVDDSHDERIIAFINMVSPATPVNLKKGECAFRQGEAKEAAFYIVNDGNLHVETDSGHKGKQAGILVEQMHRGDCFGYVSLLAKSGSKKQFTVQCDSATCTLVSVRGDDFHRLLDHSLVVSTLMQTLLKARKDHDKQARSARSIASTTRFRGL